MSAQTTGEFFKAAEVMTHRFDVLVNRHGLYGHARPDHICFRCGSRATYESVLGMNLGEVADESLVSGRKIAYIHLNRWIDTALGPIHYLELQDQKPDGSQQEGFHHIEVFPVEQGYDEMVARLVERGEKVVFKPREHHSTHEIEADGFVFVCSHEPLIEKIMREKTK